MRTRKRDEKFGALKVGSRTSIVKRGATKGIGKIDIERRNIIKERTRMNVKPKVKSLKLSGSRRIVKNTLSLVVCLVRIGAMVEKEFDGREEALCRGDMKRSEATRIGAVDLDKLSDSIERRISAIVIRIGVTAADVARRL